MPTTKGILAEQIARNYAKSIDRENIKPILDNRELYPMIEQSLNKLLKSEVVQSFSTGSIEVPTSNVITYVGSVENDSMGHYVVLPVHPISLPRNIGIWRVYDPETFPTTSYIPLVGQNVELMAGTIIKNLEGRVGYWVAGIGVTDGGVKKLRFTKDPAVSSIAMDLLVGDLSIVSEDEILPLSPDYEAIIMSDVMARLREGQISQAELNSDNQDNNDAA